MYLFGVTVFEVIPFEIKFEIKMHSIKKFWERWFWGLKTPYSRFRTFPFTKWRQMTYLEHRQNLLKWNSGPVKYTCTLDCFNKLLLTSTTGSPLNSTYRRTPLKQTFGKDFLKFNLTIQRKRKGTFYIYFEIEWVFQLRSFHFQFWDLLFQFIVRRFNGFLLILEIRIQFLPRHLLKKCC